MDLLDRKCLVLTAYTQEKAEQALRFCNNTFFWIPRNRRVLVFNNAALKTDSSISKLSKGWNFIEGSNIQHEFSAWQEGLDFFRESYGDQLSVILVNDTVAHHRKFSFFRKLAFLAALPRKSSSCIVGFTNKLPCGSHFQVYAHKTDLWVSTFLFFVDAEALKKINYRIWTREENDDCVLGGSDNAKFFTDRVSENLKKYLCEWLFEGGWYKSESLSEFNCDRFKVKAKSIINEKLLSAQCDLHDIKIRDPFYCYQSLEFVDRKFLRQVYRIERFIKNISMVISKN